MEYTVEVTIDLPRSRVVELFDDQDNLEKWQDGLKSMEVISGEPGQVGAKSRLIYDQNGREIEMTETIIKRDMPDEFTATYEAKGIWNLSAHRFYTAGPEKTRWVSENEFKLSGLMVLMGIFMRGAFPKQSLKDMNRFKEFAENA